MSKTLPQTIGVIGLGHMGGAVAARLLSCGFSVVVYDLHPPSIARLKELGAESAASCREVAEQSEILLTVLPNGPDVEIAAEGPDGILAGAKPGLLWLEMSTIDPEVTRGLAGKAAEQDVCVIDAAIGGLTVDVPKGKLLMMVGGDEIDVARARVVLDALGDTVHCGPTGAGVSMKLVNNQLAGVSLVATCEALLLGRKAGLNFDTMQKVLSRTAANTAHLHRSVPERILPRNFEPGFRLDLMVKDAGLALTLAQRLGAPQSLAALVQQMRTVALNQGFTEQDTTVLVQILEQWAGTLLDEGA